MLYLKRYMWSVPAGEGLARAERRQRLSDTKCFVCTCSRCVAEAAAEEVVAEQAAVVDTAAPEQAAVVEAAAVAETW